MHGTLYVIATPIGNLEDITLRALRILRDEISLVACEDTRQTGKLLSHFEISKPMLSYHDHNETARVGEILHHLKEGRSVALVSDAGTPLISDPGYRIVHAAVAEGFAVIPVPGASAVISSLAASGLPAESFRFLGFLPSKSLQRIKVFRELATEEATAIMYESPHRIVEALSDVVGNLGPERPVVVARELTKIHEEFLRGTAAEVLAQLKSRPIVKGEITLLIGRATETAQTSDPVEAFDVLHANGMPRMDAIKHVAKQMKLPKREVYRAVEERDNNPPGKHHDLPDKHR